uniref:Solute carrier family 40 protein n=1 Tax=Alexandrium monilatum TaxID=311494 RepID=A0A7S4QGH7_9DINO
MLVGRVLGAPTLFLILVLPTGLGHRDVVDDSCVAEDSGSAVRTVSVLQLKMTYDAQEAGRAKPAQPATTTPAGTPPSQRAALPVDGAEQLIVAGIIVFPTLYLSDALGSGLMHQHVLSEGSRFDGNHAQLWYNLMQGMGRFLGPWTARSTVQARGQDWFAAQQLAVTFAFLCIFEMLVRPFLKVKDETDACDAGLREVSL